jgi:uncharacterized protein YdbL (DUF1318 family)
MKQKITIMLAALAIVGCARVSVEAPKEPIKLDVTMRLDIYQHIERDIDAIENMVSGTPGPQSWLDDILVKPAYAQEGLSPEVEEAALRRKERHPLVMGMEAKGLLGENAKGLVEVVGAGGVEATELAKAENEDRMIIYRGIAAKNGTSTESVQTLYAQRLQSDAPSGTLIQVPDKAGNLTWINK